MNDAEMLERVAEEVRGFVERKSAPMNAEITRLRDAVEQLTASLAGVQLKHGIDGKDGIDGKSGADGKNGEDGKEGVGIARVEQDPTDLKQFDIVLDDGRRFSIQLPEGIKGEAGRDGADGANGIDGRDGRDGLHGKDGIDGKDGARGLDGKDGADGKDGERGPKGDAGADGIDGKDGIGKDGKDGVQLDDFGASIDGRNLRLSFTMSDGMVIQKDLVLRGMVLDKGIYSAGAKYLQGDAVTYGGSIWIATADTEESPGNGSKSWRLAVKRGRDGKDSE